MVAAFVTDFVGVVAFFAMVFFTAVTVVFFFGGIVLGPPLSLSLSLFRSCPRWYQFSTTRNRRFPERSLSLTLKAGILFGSLCLSECILGDAGEVR